LRELFPTALHPSEEAFKKKITLLIDHFFFFCTHLQNTYKEATDYQRNLCFLMVPQAKRTWEKKNSSLTLLFF